jgi:hypothetical protein
MAVPKRGTSGATPGTDVRQWEARPQLVPPSPSGAKPTGCLVPWSAPSN